MEYVTYDSLFLFASFVVALVCLIYQIFRDNKRKK